MIVIIKGPLGVGKTTIAKEVAKTLGFKYFSVDEKLAELGLDKVSGKCIPLKNFLLVNKEIPEGDVVVDGNFYFKEAVDDLKTELVFHLSADIDTCIERDSKREKPLGEDAVKAVYQLVKEADYPVYALLDTARTPVDQVVRSICFMVMEYVQ
ncbi:AAA family ATPase, partial [Candidatus Woesearchaeota archaeon]|nr:AAA family ATPase [Candidatus Woesearchaeota archaeon]